MKCGNFSWENGAYFKSSAQSLRSAPTEIHILLGLLVHLRASWLASAFTACYGYPVEPLDVIGLFRQDGHYYFACCNSQGSCGPVYRIDADTGYTDLFGFTDRYDWNFNTNSHDEGILEIVTIEEILRRVETGDAQRKEGPPNDMDVPWQQYLPDDKDA